MTRFTFALAAALAAAGATAVARQTAEEPLDLATPTGTLSGTLAAPAGAGKMPVVLVIAGSGPTNRDGNSALMPGKNNAYKMLADALAADGIASLRYDKRGIGKSVTPGLREADLRFETFVDDAAGWIEKLRADPRFSTVTVVGHSEGSLIGMLAAAKAGADAFVSIAGVARTASDVLRDQLRPQLATAPELAATSEQILKDLEAGKTTATVPQALMALYRPSVQPYLISWFKYTPSREIARLTVPVLIIQGTTDIQVTVAEAQALKTARADAQLAVIDGMNHVMKLVPADRAAQLASYTNPDLPLAPPLVTTIATFVHGVRGR